MKRPETIESLCDRVLAVRCNWGISVKAQGRLRSAARWLVKSYGEANRAEAYSSRGICRVTELLREEYEAGAVGHDTLRFRCRIIADVEDLADYGAIERVPRPSPWNKERNPLLRPVSDEVRDDPESVVGLALAVLDEMARSGYSPVTIEKYRLRALPRLVAYFKQRGAERYSGEVTDDFIRGLECSGREKPFFMLRPAAEHVRSMHDEGRLHMRSDYAGAVERAMSGAYGALVSEFVSWREACGMKPKTVKNDVGAVVPFLGAVCPEGPGAFPDITRERVWTARLELSEERSPRYINRMLTSARAFAAFMEERHPECPAFGQWLGPNVKVVRKRPIEGYTAEQADAIVAAAGGSTPMDKRDRAILLLLKSTGMRASDVAALELDDIIWRDNEIRVTQGKTGVAVALPLELEAGEAIAEYLLEARRDCPSRTVFTTSVAPTRPMTAGAIHGVVNRRSAAVGEDFGGLHGPHAFRRGIGARLAASGVTLGEVADVLGQSGARSAMPYVAVATERLRACCASLADVPVREGAGHADE